tara:strand:- start:2753 stop:2968 length:216 start_codon:yes stop_codon:yes gene_type:complete
MNIERAAKEHMMGQGKIGDEIKITIANNGYIIEYEWFLENVKKRNIKKVFSSLEDALDNVKKICNNYPLSF